jgi:hypothetical protein
MARFVRLLTVLLLSIGLTLVAQTPALAGGSVDPSTLTPQPWGDNISCMSTGSGITCRSDQSSFSSYTDQMCVYVNPAYTFDVQQIVAMTIHNTFHYSSSGELLSANVQVLDQERFTNLATGRISVAHGAYTETYTLMTPGDLAGALTVRQAGSRANITVQGTGNIGLAAGLVIYPPEGAPEVHGPNNQPDTIDQLCTALAG